MEGEEKGPANKKGLATKNYNPPSQCIQVLQPRIKRLV
jgi:hypothetical protein